MDFVHQPHPHIEARKEQGPATREPGTDVNSRIGAYITSKVGTMWAAYVFICLALVSLPAAIDSRNLLVIVAWTAQTFLQLALLPIIIVGQNAQARAADKRAEQTYTDAEAILHECLQLQAHLKAQDEVLDHAINDLQVVLRPQAPKRK